MAEHLAADTPTARRGWATRFFGARHTPPGAAGPVAGAATGPGDVRACELTRRLVADGREAFALLREAAGDIEEAHTVEAWRALDSGSALVPAGVAPVVRADGRAEPVEVPAFRLDRRAVTNRQFQRFVAAGGYDALEGWPREVWPSLMKFTDLSRRPGPQDWDRGAFPAELADHPVVGVCWYEAAAYAAWVGKRLPTAAEWQKAGGWPEHLSGGACHRYPWGDVYEPGRANLDGARTAPVDAFPSGATPNGIAQMTGNVWEWLADRLETIPCRPDETFQTWRPMRRIVGGAFDTYFPEEAACQFITGQPELDRRPNIGFRCAVPAARLRPRSGD